MIKSMVFLTSMCFALFILKEPTFIDTRHFKVKSLGLKRSVIEADLYYYNPNRVRLDLKGADVDVFIENTLAGHSHLDTLIQIPSRDTFAIPVVFEVEMKNLLSNAFSMLTKDELEIRMTGTAAIGRSGIFIKVPIQYTGKHKL